MATGFSSAIAAELLDAVLNSDAYDGPSNIYIKLHVGDPGSAGTSNAATETTRKEVTFGAASGGTCTSDASVSWTSISGSQDATYASFWDNVSAGNFLFSGTVTANAYTAGDTLTIASGGVSVTLSTAS